MATRKSGTGRRLVLPVLTLTAACVAGPVGIAHAAPSFDVDAYSDCTATTPPGPEQDYDGVVTACCVQNAGVPAPTKYGMGCLAPMDGASVDERPTIVMPMRPVTPENADRDLDGLINLPVPEPIP